MCGFRYVVISVICQCPANWDSRLFDVSLSRFGNICCGALSVFADSLKPVLLDFLVSGFVKIVFLRFSFFLDFLETVFLDSVVWNFVKIDFGRFQFAGFAEICFSGFAG
jgi:hypothetical protein